MKIGIMSVAHLHAEAYIHNIRALPNVEFIGFADENQARGDVFAQEFKAHQFTSYDALLAAQPDGVIICSENSRHRPLVEMAARAGVHVLCEKPLATTFADAQAIIEVCSQAGVKLMTAFPMRFSAPLQQLKAQLDANALGEIYCLNTTNQGQNPMHARAWFVDKDLAGGGALMDHIVHLADIFHWFFGDSIASVYAQSNHILHADTVAVESGGLVMLSFDNGRFATIDCSWSKPLNYPTWGGLTMELVGESGLTIVDAFSQNLNIYQQTPPAHQWQYWGSDANQAMIAEFVAAIRENRQPAVTGAAGLYALAVTLAAYDSAASGTPANIQL